MTECVNSISEPYKSWPGDYGIEQLSELTTIIRRTAIAAVTVTVLLDDFRAYKERLEAILTDPIEPPDFCATVALAEVHKWQRTQPGPPRPIQHVFEQGKWYGLKRTLHNLSK